MKMLGGMMVDLIAVADMMVNGLWLFMARLLRDVDHPPIVIVLMNHVYLTFGSPSIMPLYTWVRIN